MPKLATLKEPPRKKRKLNKPIYVNIPICKCCKILLTEPKKIIKQKMTDLLKEKNDCKLSSL